MPLILDGTNGISDVRSTTDGSAATPAIRGTDTNTGIFFPAADTIAFGEGGAESMRIDAAGNVGIGVTPSAWYTGYTASQVGVNGSVWANRTTADTNIVGIGSNQFLNSGATNRLYISNGFASRYEQSSGVHSWFTAASGTAGNAISFTQAMTLDASGNLLVGTTTNGRTDSNGTAIDSTGVVYQNHITGTASGSFYTRFSLASTQIGSISQNGTTAVAYTTSSDYRLKENIAPMTGALSTVQQLKPVTYTWKIDGSSGQGFIAHELQELVPDAVTGEKDAVDADGNPEYQGIDTSFLVATLTAAIQEQQAIINDLKSRIETLEST